jgi:hypothetical protein
MSTTPAVYRPACGEHGDHRVRARTCRRSSSTGVWRSLAIELRGDCHAAVLLVA